MPDPAIAELDSVFAWSGGALKFGVGALDETGADVAAMGLHRVLVLTDPGVLAAGHPVRVQRSLAVAGVDSFCFADVEVEPTDESIAAAVKHLAAEEFEAIVAVGGGSVIDTAKAVNVLLSTGGELLDYVNVPVGRGERPGDGLLPLIAVPTTAGSGSESSGVCVMDLVSHGVKSGISDWRLRPTLAVIDPSSTLTLPPEATLSSGLDVLSHNLESLTSRPYDARVRPPLGRRPAFTGANPFSDLLCERSLALLATALRRVVRDGADEAARYDVMLAATLTAVGASTAGVHVPHACSYAIAAQVRDHTPPGAGVRRPFLPHGLAVTSTLLATLEFTYEAAPARHRHLADLLAQPDDGVDALPASQRLVARVARLLDDLDADVRLDRFGYTVDDLTALVDGTLLQQRLLAGAPCSVGRTELQHILEDSLRTTGSTAYERASRQREDS
jgi:hydroxyacid-oxoacid transhydrogenase